MGPPVVATYIEVDPDDLTFDRDATTPQTVNVQSNGPWTVSNPDETNFTVSAAGGTGNGSFTVVPRTANDSQIPRVIDVTVTATGSTDPSMTKAVEVTVSANTDRYAAIDEFVTWDQAVQLCGNLAPAGTWRLPTYEEWQLLGIGTWIPGT